MHVSPEEFYRAWRLSAIGAGEEVERFRGEWEGVRDMKGGRWVVGEKGVVGADEGAAKREKVMDGEGVGKGKEKETEGEGDEGQGEGDGGVGIEEVADVVGRWSQGREGVEVEVDREGKGREIMVCVHWVDGYSYMGFGVDLLCRSIFPRPLGSISISPPYPHRHQSITRLSTLRARKRRRCIKPSCEVWLRGRDRMIWFICLYVLVWGCAVVRMMLTLGRICLIRTRM